MGYSPYGHKELDITEQLSTLTSNVTAGVIVANTENDRGLGKGILGKVMELQGPEGPM